MRLNSEACTMPQVCSEPLCCLLMSQRGLQRVLAFTTLLMVTLYLPL